MKGRKLRFKSTIWNIRKKQTFNQNKMKKREFFFKKVSLRRLWDICKKANI